MAVLWVIWLALIVLIVAGFWKMFEKASKPGWAAIVPFYNLWVLCEVATRPGWWFILMYIPFAGIVFWFIVWIDLAKAFGKGTGYGVGAAIFPYVFAPILGFGQARYQGQQG